MLAQGREVILTMFTLLFVCMFSKHLGQNMLLSCTVNMTQFVLKASLKPNQPLEADVTVSYTVNPEIEAGPQMQAVSSVHVGSRFACV